MDNQFRAKGYIGTLPESPILLAGPYAAPQDASDFLDRLRTAGVVSGGQIEVLVELIGWCVYDFANDAIPLSPERW